MRTQTYTLITGASEGFGKALALDCARRGRNLVLVALENECLHALGRFLQREYGIQTICLGLDLSRETSCQMLSQIIREKGIALDMLINNAGIGGTHGFLEKDPEFYCRQVRLNAIAPLLLCYLLYDNLIKNGPSYILNVSSLAAFFPIPVKQVYGATKSFLLAFSQSLNQEWSHRGVFVATVCPGGMNTSMSLTLENRCLHGIGHWSVLDPEVAARYTLDALFRQKEIIIPGFWNRCLLKVSSLLPVSIRKKIIRKNLGKKRELPKNWEIWSKPLTPMPMQPLSPEESETLNVA